MIKPINTEIKTNTKHYYVKRTIWERHWCSSAQKQHRRKITNRKFRRNKLSTDFIGGIDLM
jgi:hypothetical protein